MRLSSTITRSTWAIVLLACGLAPRVHADTDPPDIVLIDRPVIDLADVVSDSDAERLDGALRTLRDETRVHMAALLIRSTDGVPIEDYALLQAEAWGGGDAGIDQGVLLVIAIDDRRMRLEVGYGLEDRLTDGISRRILDLAKPHLRDADHATAVATIIAGVSDIMQGIELPPSPRVTALQRERLQLLRLLLLMLLSGGLLGALGYLAPYLLTRARGASRWYLLVWVLAAAPAMAIAQLAPDELLLPSLIVQLGMLPMGYVLMRGLGGSVFGTAVVAGLVLAIIACGYVAFADEYVPFPPPPLLYVASPFFVLIASFCAVVASLLVGLAVLVPVAFLEAAIRNRFSGSSTFEFYKRLADAVARTLSGDPDSEMSDMFDGGGGYSFSSDWSSSSSSYSGSGGSGWSGGGGSSGWSGGGGSSGWSGGGGSFGGGGASSSW